MLKIFSRASGMSSREEQEMGNAVERVGRMRNQTRELSQCSIYIYRYLYVCDQLRVYIDTRKGERRHHN